MPDEEREAVGLRYALGDPGAPEVTARGRGEIAERIVAVAQEHGVPIKRDPDLLQLLAVARLGDEVPVEVFDAVARLLTFLYDLNQSQPTSQQNADF